MRRFTFLKGQATMNDFVILEDHHGMHELSSEFVRQLCNRRGGIGADGVMRVVRAQYVPGWQGDAELWFMDYRQSDGQEVDCSGNALRLFARHLMNEQLVSSGRFDVATQAGVRNLRVSRGGMISARLPKPTVTEIPDVVVAGKARSAILSEETPAHLVVFLDHETYALPELPSRSEIEIDESVPEDAEIVFVVESHPGSISLRTRERQSETAGSGTGVVAAALAYNHQTGREGEVRVSTTGGDLWVQPRKKYVWLTGSAVIYIRGEYWA